MWRLRLYWRIARDFLKWAVLIAVFVKFWLGVANAELRVIDGDTLVLSGERIRIFGLDCPERRDPGGPAATAKLREILTGKSIALKRREVDRYQRTVAKVFADGRDVACMMIRAGVCREFTRYSRGEYEGCKTRE